jgi:predicted dehydrogenase
MVRVALIGTGSVALQNHVTGIRLHPQGAVTALCDPDVRALENARTFSGVTRTYTDYTALLAQEDIDAVVIATPNNLHMPIALAAIKAGRHVLCEKPLGMSHAETEAMLLAAEQAHVVHMTAFTYRFVPAIRWMKQLISEGALGTPFHIRVHRLQDWADRTLGWRQKKAISGSGELGDMLSHRIDYAHYLIGSFVRLIAHTKQCLAERRRADGQVELSDVEDWVAVIAELAGGVTAVFESTKMATGRGFGAASVDSVEINGSDATLVYALERPHELLIGRRDGRLESVAVPEALLKIPGSTRNPHAGDPLQGFRYDQAFEFVQAILDHRPASPDFSDGSRVQAVMDAALRSAARGAWVEVSGEVGRSRRAPG